MPLRLLGDRSGKTSATVANILVAIAFIAFCGVIAVMYLKGGDKGGDKPAPPARQDAATTAQEKTSAKPGATIEISFYSSDAKKKWIDAMVQRFNGSQAKVGNAAIRVKAFHVTSGGSYDALKTGKMKPDIWSPGDESWLQLAAAHWRDVKQKELFREFSPVVDIPLVIAMWEPMAKALGHPGPIGWKEIAKVAANPKGWGAYGHPEWGKFRWGHAHPDANSGFLAVLSILYASVGKTSGMTTDDLRKPQTVAFLKSLEETVDHYGLSNSWIDQIMHLKGPAYLSAAVQYENTIIESNQKHQNRPFKLVAVYPTEGAFWTQHPAAILTEEWMTPEKHKACTVFLEFLLGAEAQRSAMEMGLRPISKSIALSSPFNEDHGVLQQVALDRVFAVPEEGVLQRVRDLWEDVKAPATISLVIDQSASMNGDPIEKAREGAVRFVRSMKPRDQLEVIIFNHMVHTLVPLCSIRDCGEQAAARVQGVFADGGTALHQAILDAYRRLLELQKKDPNRRYGVVVLSDGRDTSSKINRYDFLDALPKGEAIDSPKIFTIAYGQEADKELLAQVSGRTNARTFTSSTEEITRTYQELSANF